MRVPLSLTVPAAAASCAYLNARWFISQDWHMLSSLARSTIRIVRAEKQDRVNLFYALEEHAQSKSTADKEFLVYEGRSWTFKETYDTALKYSTWLKKTYGIGPKEIVAMEFMNCPQFVFLWLGLWSLGAIPAFINYNLTGKPLSHSVKVSSARIIFVDSEVRSSFAPETLDEFTSPNFRDGKGPIEVVFYDDDLEQEILRTKGEREPDSSRSGPIRSDMSILIYTSGTTGLPKPAIVSWGKSRVGGSYVSGFINLKKSDRFYTCMPLYHSSGSVLGFNTCLLTGCAFILGHRFSTKKFWEEVRQHDATVIQYVGETLRYLLTAPPQIDPITCENLDAKNKLRLAFGNGLRPDVWEKFKSRFGVETIAEFYGATEGPSASWNLASNDFASGAVGRTGLVAQTLLGTSIALVELDWETERPWRDPETGLCKRVPTGQPGELLFRVDEKDINSKFQGYFNNANASEGKVLRDAIKKGDAWFRTGDVMRWDNEGRMYFSDRIGDTFRWKSENVSTNEVSEVLGLHPQVHEANVYGVEIPHHDGRAGCVAIVLDGDATPELLTDLATHSRRHLPRYAVPLFLKVVSEVQATGNNKQQKHVLRSQGVDPGKTEEDGHRMFWLEGESYVPFGWREWEELQGGRVRL